MSRHWRNSSYDALIPDADGGLRLRFSRAGHRAQHVVHLTKPEVDRLMVHLLEPKGALIAGPAQVWKARL